MWRECYLFTCIKREESPLRMTALSHLWPNADRRRRTTRRMIERAEQFAEQLGGFDQVSPSQADLLKRAVSLSLWLEDEDELRANGANGTCDLAEYQAASRVLRRILSTDLSANRKPRNPARADATARAAIAAWHEARRTPA